MFSYAYASVQGHTHKLKNLVNQDAIQIQKIENGLIVALADGHGGAPCFRSAIGSAFAVEIACQVLKNRCKEWSYSVQTAKKFGYNCLQEIEKLWSEKALCHLSKNGFKNEEVDSLSQHEKRTLGKNALMAYGTTIMASVISPQGVLIINIGDGNVLIQNQNASFATMQKGSCALGNETESLALPEAYTYGNAYTYSVDNLQGLLLSTDGYANSFKTPSGFEKVLSDLCALSNSHSIESIQNQWPQWLEETSRSGSGDDITACFVSVEF